MAADLKTTARQLREKLCSVVPGTDEGARLLRLALADCDALIAQMQREAVQPVAWAILQEKTDEPALIDHEKALAFSKEKLLPAYEYITAGWTPSNLPRLVPLYAAPQPNPEPQQDGPASGFTPEEKAKRRQAIAERYAVTQQDGLQGAAAPTWENYSDLIAVVEQRLDVSHGMWGDVPPEELVAAIESAVLARIGARVEMETANHHVHSAAAASEASTAQPPEGYALVPQGRTTGHTLTERKANDLLSAPLEHPPKLTGYVIQYADGERAIIELSAVRWLSREQMQALMHGIEDSAKGGEQQ